jgi:hypothetical protein
MAALEQKLAQMDSGVHAPQISRNALMVVAKQIVEARVVHQEQLRHAPHPTDAQEHKLAQMANGDPALRTCRNALMEHARRVALGQEPHAQSPVYLVIQQEKYHLRIM